eukprot:6082812-Prymnesium_polylepis.1
MVVKRTPHTAHIAHLSTRSTTLHSTERQRGCNTPSEAPRQGTQTHAERCITQRIAITINDSTVPGQPYARQWP